MFNTDVIKAAFFGVLFVTGLPDILEEQSTLSLFRAPKDFNTAPQTVQWLGIAKSILK